MPNEKRTQMFAWYNLVGSFAIATGALAGGWLAQVLQDNAMDGARILSRDIDGIRTRWIYFYFCFST